MGRIGKDGRVDEAVVYWTTVVSDKVVLLHSAERAVCQEPTGLLTRKSNTHISFSVSIPFKIIPSRWARPGGPASRAYERLCWIRCWSRRTSVGVHGFCPCLVMWRQRQTSHFWGNSSVYRGCSRFSSYFIPYRSIARCRYPWWMEGFRRR